MNIEDLDERDQIFYALLVQINFNLIEMKRTLEDVSRHTRDVISPG